MACAEFLSHRVGRPMRLTASLINEGAWGAKLVGDGMSVMAKMVRSVIMTSERIGNGITFFASVVCTIPQDRYLYVLSDDVIWLTDANNYNVDVVVKANVRWTIE